MEKKIYYLSLLFLSVLLITCTKKTSETKYIQKELKTFTFYKKNNLNQAHKLSDAPESITYSMIDGRLKFDNEDDFNLFINYLEEDDIVGWESSIDFHSLYSTLLEDEKYTVYATLNRNGIVQVGHYIFKLIPASRKVLVLSDAAIDHLYELEGATDGNSLIQAFSFDDEVFGKLEEQGGVIPSGATEEKSICRDRYANENSKTLSISYIEPGYYFRSDDATMHLIEFRGTLEYKKIGIAVQLICKYSNTNKTIESSRRAFESASLKTKNTLFHLVYKYTPRCRNTVSNEVDIIISDKKNGSYNVYSNTRDCKNYSLSSIFSFQSYYTLIWRRDVFSLNILD